MGHVCQVLQRLLQYHLFIKAETSKGHQSAVSFLGFITALGQIQMACSLSLESAPAFPWLLSPID